MAKAAEDSVVRRVCLRGYTEGKVMRFPAFNRKRHHVPSNLSSAAREFFARLCEPELAAETEAFFQRIRGAMGYKRKEISLTMEAAAAVLETRDFVLEWEYALDERDPTSYRLSRSLRFLRVLGDEEWGVLDETLGDLFSDVSVELKARLSVEAVIDAVEALDPGLCRMEVNYPSDCHQCTLRVPGVDAEVVYNGASLEMHFPRKMESGVLWNAFDSVRKSFDLSGNTLSALLHGLEADRGTYVPKALPFYNDT